MKYDLKDLERFIRVVDEGSISRAAQALFVSQPALSRQIGELEDRLGVRLLERTTRRMKTTPAGKALERHARRILAECASLDKELGAVRGGASTLLRLGYGSNGQFDYAMRITAMMQRMHPEVSTVTEAGDMLEALFEGRVDAALLMSCELEGHGWLDAMPLERAGLSAFVQAGGPHEGSQPVSIESLRAERFVLPVPRNVTPSLRCTTLFDSIRGWLIAHGVDDAQIATANGAQAFSIEVSKGQAVGLMPDSSRVIANALVRCRPIAECREGFEVALAWRMQDAPRDALTALREAAVRLFDS